ncbi:MAG: methytransferase partner Trm112, partial [Archaeoglobaceae archaeon]
LSNRNMRRSLLDILACPKCKSDLDLEVLQEESEEIISGKLICKGCKAVYPIEDGIPNLLPQL